MWQRLAEHPNAKLETARAADPEGDILDWAQNAGLGAWEQIALAPVYVDQVQAERAALRTFIEAEIMGSRSYDLVARPLEPRRTAVGGGGSAVAVTASV